MKLAKTIYDLMKKIFTLTLLLLAGLFTIAQTVTTYAGKANDDPDNNVERGSGVDLTDTYFSEPNGITFDNNGKMYISERNKIRAVISNKLYIRAGSVQNPNLSEGYKNAGGIQATFRMPQHIVSDASGNIYVADADNHCIRKIAAFTTLGNSQQVTTFAGAEPTPGLPGNGTSGSVDGKGTAARFNKPTGICIDKNGNFYVSEYGNFTIRKIRPDGTVTTIAGNAGVEGTADGTGTAATFGGPWGIAMYDDNHVVVADQWNTNIRKINVITKEVTTLAGPTTGGDPRQVNGTLAEARFKDPKGIVVVNGIIYVTDQNIIRAIDVENNSVTTFAGNAANVSITDGTGSSAAFTELSSITTDGNGNLYVTENSRLVASNVIRKVSIDELAPTPNFTASKQNLVVNESVTLTNTSGGQPSTSRMWSFSPASSSVVSGGLDENVVEVKFASTGFYAVSLSVTNDYGTESVTKNDFLTVSTTGNVTRYEESDMVKLYPVPANDKVILELSGNLTSPKTEINLFHTNGQLIRSIDPSQREISTSELPDGIYFITVVTDKAKYAKRLVVSHK